MRGGDRNFETGGLADPMASAASWPSPPPATRQGHRAPPQRPTRTLRHSPPGRPADGWGDRAPASGRHTSDPWQPGDADLDVEPLAETADSSLRRCRNLAAAEPGAGRIHCPTAAAAMPQAPGSWIG